MSKPTMTENLARAVALDAGNRSMREHGRRVWEWADVIVATDVYARCLELQVSEQEHTT